MNEPLDELYLTWLYSQIGVVTRRHSTRTYWALARQLYNKPFIGFVPNDDNREADGKDLRFEFIDREDIQEIDIDWMELDCSMLEMLIVLARIMAFEAEGEPRDWFWHMLKNIRLDSYNDMSGVPYRKIDDILDRVIQRTYHPSGYGGLFPLKHAAEDQRKVELFYQLSAYLLEKKIV